MSKELIELMFKECGRKVNVVDVTPVVPTPRDLVKEIAMDIGKDVVAYIDVMYPEAVKATSSTFRLSLRNSIYNQIMAALEVTDEGAIKARLVDRKKWRREWKAQWKRIREKQPTKSTEK